MSTLQRTHIECRHCGAEYDEMFPAPIGSAHPPRCGRCDSEHVVATKVISLVEALWPLVKYERFDEHVGDPTMYGDAWLVLRKQLDDAVEAGSVYLGMLSERDQQRLSGGVNLILTRERDGSRDVRTFAAGRSRDPVGPFWADEVDARSWEPEPAPWEYRGC